VQWVLKVAHLEVFISGALGLWQGSRGKKNLYQCHVFRHNFRNHSLS